MGSVNSVPVVSQVKSVVQAIGGDREGARETQEDFSQKCIVISQIRSAVEAIKGDKEAAVETQLKFLRNVENIVDAVPVVGHVKGAVHYACHDKDKGDQSMKSASRTIVVAGLGIAGGVVGGPGGAVASGMAGGVIIDGVTTAVDSAVHKKYRPEGIIAGITMLADKNIDKKKKIGIGFDTVTGVAFDGLLGIGAYRLMRITLVYCKTSGFIEKTGVKSYVAVNGEHIIGTVALRGLQTVISHIKKILEEAVLKGKGSWEDIVKEYLKSLLMDPGLRVRLKNNVDKFCPFANEMWKENNSVTHVKTVKDETDINCNKPDKLKNGDMLFEGFVNAKTDSKDLYKISVWYVGENQDSDSVSIYMDAREYFGEEMTSESITYNDLIMNLDSELPKVDENDISVILVPDDNKTGFLLEKEERNGYWIIKAEIVDKVGEKRGIKTVLSIISEEEVNLIENSAEHKQQTFI